MFAQKHGLILKKEALSIKTSNFQLFNTDRLYKTSDNLSDGFYYLSNIQYQKSKYDSVSGRFPNNQSFDTDNHINAKSSD